MANTGNTQQQINYGAAVNDGEGDPLRTAFIKTDDNFDNVWLAGPVGSNITITNNTVQVNNTNGNLILSPNGTGVIQTNSRLLPRLNNTYDFGSTTLKYRTGYFGAGGVVAEGNVTADYFVGNGSQLTGIAANYSNTNVASYLTTYTGNIAAGNIAVTNDIVVAGDVTAGVFYGTFAGNISGNLVVPGSNTWVLYNNNGNAGADSNFRYDSATDTLVVNGTANLATVNATSVAASGNVSGAYILGNGSALTAVTGANVTGTVANAAYATSAGTASTAITIAGANVTGTVANAAYATSAGSATSATTAATVTAAAQPNITSVGTMVSLSATGNITGGNIVTAGNVSGTYIFGNGSQLTGITAASSYGNANVAAYLPTYTGQLAGNQLNITRSGNTWSMIDGALNFPTGALWYSDISTNDEFISSNVDGYLNFQTFDSTSNVATELHMEHGLVHINIYNGSLKQWEFNQDGTTHFPGDLLPQANLGGNLGSEQYQWQDLWVSNNTIYINSVPLTLTAGNVLTVNGEAVLSNDSDTAISTTGNITADYFIGNGSQLTGIVAVSSYGNANVVANLAALGSNPISTTGNVTAGYFIGNGSLLTSLPAPAVTQDITSNGAMSLMTYDGVIKYVSYATVEPASGNISAGNISAIGNIAGNYFIGNGSQLTGISGGNASTGNVTFDDQIVIGTGDEFGGSGLYLAIGPTSAANLQYFRVRGGDNPTHIHFDTGNNQYYDQYFGDDGKFVKLEAGGSGNVVIGTQSVPPGPSFNWTFSSDGNLTVPGNIQTITTGYAFSSNIANITTGNPTVIVSLAGNVFGDPETGQVTITDVIGTTEANNTWYFAAVEVNAIQLYNDAALNNPVDGTEWTAYVTGGEAVSVGYSDFSVTGGNIDIITVGGNVAIITNSGTAWTFSDTGNLELPSGGVVYETGIPSGGLSGNTIALKPAGGTNADQQLLIYPTAGNVDANHLHLTSGNLWNTELFLGDDNFFVKLANTGNIVINSNDNVGNSSQWNFNNFGTLTLPGGSQLRPLGSNLDIFAGAGSYVNLITSDESSLMGVDNGGGYIVTAGGTWSFDTTGNLTLPTVANESTRLVGTRKVIGGLTATSPYSVILNAGGTPTVAYTSSPGTNSVKVTFATQSNGAGFQWEQFDVVAVESQDSLGTVNFVVSNRVKGAAGIADTAVTATMSGGQIQISLNLAAAQTSGGWSSFDAVEFGYMVD
jgi:hypothetical protein